MDVYQSHDEHWCHFRWRGSELGLLGGRYAPVWGSRDGLLVALEASPDRVHDYKRLLLLGLLLQAASLHHVDTVGI